MFCPHCGKGAVGHGHTGGNEAPKSGDVSICPGCMCLSVYASGFNGLYRRKPTAEEMTVFLADQRVQDALGALAVYRDSYAAVEALRKQAGK